MSSSSGIAEKDLNERVRADAARGESKAATDPLGVGFAPHASEPTGPPTGADRALLRQLVRTVGEPPLELCLWDHEPALPVSEPLGRIVFRDRGALFASVFNAELGVGDMYSAGRIDIEGDLITVMHYIYRHIEAKGVNAFKRVWGRLPSAPRNSHSNSRHHIHHHYDLGNDFYRLWLDERMVYTCAYYPHPEATLEQAQLDKMHHVARKLELEPGQRVVEAGCGWGSLAMHLAEHYGVHVTAFNISKEQIAYAREELTERGLEGKVDFVQDDYRNISGQFDRFVSVGMLEHVGLDEFATLGDVINRSLRRDGRGLIHSVGRMRATAPNAWLEKRIFPGSYPPSLREMMAIFEPHQLSIMDIENLRLHYAQTLMEWLKRFDDNVDVVREEYGDTFVRAWRLYLGGCAASFLSNSLQLFQVVFAPVGNNQLPLGRHHMYGDAGARWQFDEVRPTTAGVLRASR